LNIGYQTQRLNTLIDR